MNQEKYATFTCKDKIVATLKPKSENSNFDVASNHDSGLRECVCVIGNSDVPAGAEVLVPALCVPPNGATQLPDGTTAYVLDMARVVAWNPQRPETKKERADRLIGEAFIEKIGEEEAAKSAVCRINIGVGGEGDPIPCLQSKPCPRHHLFKSDVED